MKIEVEVDLQRVEESVVDGLIEKINDQISEVITDRVSSTIDARLEVLCDQTLQAGIDACIAKGWRRTNSYGEPIGDAVTLVDRIRDGLFKHYTSERRTSDALDQAVRSVFESHFANEIADARKRFRELVDKQLANHVQEILRRVVGIKE